MSELRRQGHHYGVLHFHAEREGDLIEVVATATSSTPEQVREWVDLGAVYIQEERAPGEWARGLGVPTLKTPAVTKGAHLRVHSRPRRFDTSKLAMPEILVFDHADFVVLDKPSGIPVHATVDNACENLLFELQRQQNQKFFITHRLDIATSGLMVYAKTTEFQKRFNSYLTAGKVRKLYRARVEMTDVQKFRIGESLVHYMEPSPRAPKTVSVEMRPGWLRCALKVLAVKPSVHTHEVSPGLELLIELETGRTHQIRAQLSALGSPILGDRAYGFAGDLGWPAEKIALQSWELSFPENFRFTSTRGV